MCNHIFYFKDCVINKKYTMFVCHECGKIIKGKNALTIYNKYKEKYKFVL